MYLFECAQKYFLTKKHKICNLRQQKKTFTEINLNVNLNAFSSIGSTVEYQLLQCICASTLFLQIWDRILAQDNTLSMGVFYSSVLEYSNRETWRKKKENTVLSI